MTIPLAPDLRNLALALTEDFSELLDELLGGHIYRCGELPAPPIAPGVYLLAESDRVLHVGRTRNLQERRRNQTGLSNDRFTATYAFRLAVKNSSAERDDLPTQRDALEQHEEFKPYFEAAKQYVRGLDFRCVEIADHPRQAMFEICASIATGLPPELWRTH